MSLDLTTNAPVWIGLAVDTDNGYTWPDAFDSDGFDKDQLNDIRIGSQDEVQVWANGWMSENENECYRVIIFEARPRLNMAWGINSVPTHAPEPPPPPPVKRSRRKAVADTEPTIRRRRLDLGE